MAQEEADREVGRLRPFLYFTIAVHGLVDEINRARGERVSQKIHI